MYEKIRGKEVSRSGFQTNHRTASPICIISTSKDSAIIGNHDMSHNNRLQYNPNRSTPQHRRHNTNTKIPVQQRNQLPPSFSRKIWTSRSPPFILQFYDNYIITSSLSISILRVSYYTNLERSVSKMESRGNFFTDSTIYRQEAPQAVPVEASYQQKLEILDGRPDKRCMSCPERNSSQHPTPLAFHHSLGSSSSAFSNLHSRLRKAFRRCIHVFSCTKQIHLRSQQKLPPL